MSGIALRTAIAVIFAFHGIGQLMGVIAALKLFGAGGTSGPAWLQGWSAQSWLFDNLAGSTAARVIGAILFLAASIGFIASVLALQGWLVPHEWWRTLAIAAAVISLIAISLYWNALIFLFPHKLGNIGVNLGVLLCLLLIHWPSEADIGF